MKPRLPDVIEGYGPVRPFAGAFANIGAATRTPVRVCSVRPGAAKLLPSIRAAIEACGLRDGATISFHHHLRNGDDVLRAVMAEIAALGLRGIKVAASSLFPRTPGAGVHQHITRCTTLRVPCFLSMMARVQLQSTVPYLEDLVRLQKII